MKKLYIYGCSGFGLEVYSHLKDSTILLGDKIYKNVNFCGFIGDKKYIQDDFLQLCAGDISILDNDTMLILAIGKDMAFKRKIYTMLKDRVAFPTLKHNHAITHSKYIGFGNIIAAFVVISTQSTIGNFNIFHSHSAIGHNTQIKDFNTLSSFSSMMGYSSLGDGNILGVGACLLPRACIGDGNIVAPGSYIYKRFRDENRISGNPAIATRIETKR